MQQKIILCLTEFNTEIDQANLIIDSLKENFRVVDKSNLEFKLNKLKIIRDKFTDNAQLVSKYNMLQQEKTENKKKIISLTQELNDKANSNIDNYGKETSIILSTFTSDFKLKFGQISFVGSSTSANTSIEITLKNNEKIPLTNQQDLPCFKTIFSEGDKNALAFAYFLAKIFSDPDLCNKTIFIDDPLSSFDSARRTRTIEYIIKISKIAKCVIVCTHNLHFAAELNSIAKKAGIHVKNLIIQRNGLQGSSIESYNLDDTNSSKYVSSFKRVKIFINSGIGNQRIDDVASDLRIIMEYYLKVKYPTVMQDNDDVSEFIYYAKNRPELISNPYAQQLLKKIEAIGLFIHGPHHTSVKAPTTLEVREVEMYANEVVNIVEN